jgi:hypothetical protein
MGFAPMNDPKIAVCVYVENAGVGATYGVPIGALMIQRYLQGNSPGLMSRGHAMANRHTITYPKVKKTATPSTTGNKADKHKKSTIKPVTSNNDGSQE